MTDIEQQTMIIQSCVTKREHNFSNVFVTDNHQNHITEAKKNSLNVVEMMET